MFSWFFKKYTIQLRCINRHYELEIRESNKIIQLSLLYGYNILEDFMYYFTKNMFIVKRQHNKILIKLRGSDNYKDFIKHLEIFEKAYNIFIF